MKVLKKKKKRESLDDVVDGEDVHFLQALLAWES